MGSAASHPPPQPAPIGRLEADGPAECIHDLFFRQVERTPDEVAVIGEDGCLTYRELGTRAGQVARALRACGVGPDVVVGVMMDRSVDMVTALLGVLRAGGAYLPVEVGTPTSRILALVADSHAPVCLVDGACDIPLSDVDCMPLSVAACRSDGHAAVGAPPVVSGANLCSVYYTSGSTGGPKGVASTHSGWLNRMRWMQRTHQLHRGETVLQKTTLTFDDAAVEIFWPLQVGGRVALLPPNLQTDPWAIIEAAVEYEAVHLQFVPSVLGLFLDALTDQDVAALGRLRTVLSSGEALRPSLVGRFRELFADRVRLENTWGATEVSIDSTCHVCGFEDATGAGAVSLGRAIDGNEVCVLDAGGTQVPPSFEGELCIGGTGLARGYLNDPARTAERFVPHPYRPGQRIYLTGDRGQMRADGSCEFLGRLDDQVKIRGVRLELGEIESAFLASPDVEDVALLVRQNREGDKRIAAYLVLAEGAAATPGDLRGFVRDRLPRYAVPSTIRTLDGIPRLPNGKLDRQALGRLHGRSDDA